jgi:hypothetical protein
MTTPMRAPFPIAPCHRCGDEVPNPQPFADGSIFCDDCCEFLSGAGRTCSICDAECGGHS